MPAKSKAASDAAKGKSKSAVEVKRLLEGVKAMLESQLRFESVPSPASAHAPAPVPVAAAPAAAPAAAAPATAPAPATAAVAAAEPMSASKKKREKEKAKKAAAAAAATGTADVKAPAPAAPAAAAAAAAKADPKAAAKAGGTAADAKTRAPAPATAADVKPRLRRDTEAELWGDVVALWDVMGKVMKLQSDLDADDLADEAALTPALKAQRMAAFAQWLQREAPDCKYGEKFEFATDVAEGSGVRATKDLSDGEHFMSIPRRVCMTLDTAADPDRSAHPKLAELLTAPDSVCRAIPSLGLAVHLLMESLAPDSFWREYIDCLPKSGAFALPIFFSLEDLRYLRGSPLLYDTLRLQKSTIRQYALVYLQCAKAGHLKLPLFSFRQFRWAVAVVMTRQNRLPRLNADGSPAAPGSAGSNTIALIPGWDFCNYSDGKLATFYSPRHDASESFTMSPVRKGDQIHIYYGTRPNAKLFMFSGFVYDQHTNDYVDALIDFHALCPPAGAAAAADPLHKLKALLLQNLGIRSPNPEKGGPDALPSHHWFALPAALEPVPAASGADRPNLMPSGYRSLLPFLRVCALDKDEAARALKLKPADANGPAGEQGLLPFVSERNERAALALARRWVEALQKQYRLTEQQLDSALAAGGVAPPLPPAPNAAADAGGDAKDAKAPAPAAAGAGAALTPNARLALRMLRVEVRLYARASAAIAARVALLDSNAQPPSPPQKAP